MVIGRYPSKEQKRREDVVQSYAYAYASAEAEIAGELRVSHVGDAGDAGRHARMVIPGLGGKGVSSAWVVILQIEPGGHRRRPAAG